MTNEPKIQKAISEKIEPLFEIWKRKANLTDEEALVVYYKIFSPESSELNTKTIQDILADKLDKSYEFYHERKIRRIFQRARKKINKILP